MPALNQNIAIWAGDGVELTFELLESDGVTPLDITGSTVRWALASVYDIETALITKSSANPGEITIISGEGGVVSIFIDPDDTDMLGGEPYYHEVEVIDSVSAVTVAIGSVTINKTTLH